MDKRIELDHTIVPSRDKLAAARQPIYHFCFRVGDADFDAILGRLRSAGIRYRSAVRGPQDMAINHHMGGRGLYGNEPDGHQWELLTVSHARPAR